MGLLRLARGLGLVSLTVRDDPSQEEAQAVKLNNKKLLRIAEKTQPVICIIFIIKLGRVQKKKELKITEFQSLRF